MSTNSSTKITKTGLGGSTAIAGRTVLVTGADRGIGQALVEEALRRDGLGFAGPETCRS